MLYGLYGSVARVCLPSRSLTKHRIYGFSMRVIQTVLTELIKNEEIIVTPITAGSCVG